MPPLGRLVPPVSTLLFWSHEEARFASSGFQRREADLDREQMQRIPPRAAVWMDQEGVMLREISQLVKGKYHMISLFCGV